MKILAIIGAALLTIDLTLFLIGVAL